LPAAIRKRDAEFGGEGATNRRRVEDLAKGSAARRPALRPPTLDRRGTVRQLDDVPIDAELKARLEAAAAREDRPVASFVRRIVVRALDGEREGAA